MTSIKWPTELLNTFDHITQVTCMTSTIQTITMIKSNNIMYSHIAIAYSISRRGLFPLFLQTGLHRWLVSIQYGTHDDRECRTPTWMLHCHEQFHLPFLFGTGYGKLLNSTDAVRDRDMVVYIVIIIVIVCIGQWNVFHCVFWKS